MTATRDTTGAEPALGATEQGVLIIHLDPAVAASEIHNGQPTPLGLQLAGQQVGMTKPTDVIVFAARPWHVAGVPSALRPHPQVHIDHPETILRLRVGKDTACWWSRTEFEITDIALHSHPAPAAGAAAPAPPAHTGSASASSASLPEPPAPYPFFERVKCVPIKNAAGAVIRWEARSTVPVPLSNDQTYKITFKIGGQTIDPDMFCGGG
jgi:hypothetical protein